jgi:hypothetical protein
MRELNKLLEDMEKNVAKAILCGKTGAFHKTSDHVENVEKAKKQIITLFEEQKAKYSKDLAELSKEIIELKKGNVY